MTRADKTPTFNMKVVVQETGLKPDTLRAWERRYGMPNPQRTAGGHRLYSQYEIDMLKWLIERQDEGVSISHAIEMWQQHLDEGRDPLQIMPLEAEESTPFTALSGSTVDQMRQEWMSACLDFDERRAQFVLAQAFAMFPMETVCFDVLQRSLTEIGTGWYEGRVTVQQEHFASSLAIRQLEALLAAMSTAARHGRVLVACPPMEQHTFSPLIITLLLRRRGWDVVYLGANVPVEQLGATVNSVQPQLVIASAQTLNTAGTMREMADFLNEMDVPFAYGGAVFNFIPEVRRYIAGHFLGTELQDVPQTVQHLIQTQPDLPAFEEASPAYRAALLDFLEHRSAIEADIYTNVRVKGLTASELSNANEDFGNNISAALSLGHMHLISANLAWIHGLLVNYHYRMPEQAMQAYVTTYEEAARRHLGPESQPLLDWLAELSASKAS